MGMLTAGVAQTRMAAPSGRGPAVRKGASFGCVTWWATHMMIHGTFEQKRGSGHYVRIHTHFLNLIYTHVKC